MKLIVTSAFWMIIAIVATALMTARIHNGTGSGWLVSYLLATNLVAFVLYVYDKFASPVADALPLEIIPLRVPEAVLIWLLGFFGGLPGALLGMALAHHKTSKAPFQAELSLAGVLSAALGVALYLGVTRWHWLTQAQLDDFIAVSTATILDVAQDLAPSIGQLLS